MTTNRMQTVRLIQIRIEKRGRGQGWACRQWWWLYPRFVLGSSKGPLQRATPSHVCLIVPLQAASICITGQPWCCVL